MLDFLRKAPVSAAEAATIILDGCALVLAVLIGEDARTIDAAVRAKPRPPTTTPTGSALAQALPALPALTGRAFSGIAGQNSADKSESEPEGRSRVGRRERQGGSV